MRTILRGLGVLILIAIIGFGLIQLIPFGHNHTNPPAAKEPTWDSPTTRALAKRACFDCHSNETVWPWYTSVAPVSWLTERDVLEGRQRLNFSDYGGIRGEGGREGGRGENEIARVIERGSMPPFYYVWIHPTAGLTDQEKQQVITGLQNSLK